MELVRDVRTEWLHGLECVMAKLEDGQATMQHDNNSLNYQPMELDNRSDSANSLDPDDDVAVDEGEIAIRDYTEDDSQKFGRIKGRTARDRIHSFFNFDFATKISACKHCDASIKLRNTTNLRRHLQAKHPELFAHYCMLTKQRDVAPLMRQKRGDVGQTTPPPTTSASASAVGVRRTSLSYEPFLETLARAFSANGLPARLIEDSSFQAAFRFGGVIDFPNRWQLANAQHSLLDRIRQKIKAQIDAVRCVSIGVDVWRWRQPYSTFFLAISAHYYCEEEGVLKRSLIGCRSIKPTECIEVVYKRILDEWNISGAKIFRVIIDNGSNFVKSFRDALRYLLKRKEAAAADRPPPGQSPKFGSSGRLESESRDAIESRDSIADASDDKDVGDDDSNSPDVDDESAIDYELEESDYDQRDATSLAEVARCKRLGCFASDLALAVQCGLNASPLYWDTHDKVNVLISKLISCPNGLDRSIWRPFKPRKSCWIYWYYVFDKVARLNGGSIPIIESEVNAQDDEFTADNWRLLEQVRDLLVVFAKAIADLQGEHYSSISSIYAMLSGILLKLNKAQKTSGTIPEIRTVAGKIESAIRRRFEKVLSPSSPKFESIYLVAAFLNPKWTALVTSELLPVVSKELQAMLISLNRAATSQQTETLANIPVGHDEDDRESSDGDNDDCLALAMSLCKKNLQNGVSGARSGASQMMTSSSTPIKNSNWLEMDLKMELRLFQTDREHCSIDKDFDVIAYWKSKKVAYPNLYAIATILLASPATSMPFERVMSRAACLFCRDGVGSDRRVEREIFHKMNSDI